MMYLSKSHVPHPPPILFDILIELICFPSFGNITEGFGSIKLFKGLAPSIRGELELVIKPFS